MKVSNSQQMRNIDKSTMEKYKVPGIILMENAANSVVKKVLQVIQEKNFNKKVLIVAGTGNNGGDGFAIARILNQKGIDVTVAIIGNSENIKGDAKINYDIINEFLIKCVYINKSEQIKILEEQIKNNSIIIDAIFGTGLCRDIEGYRVFVVEAINKYSNYTIAVDIPSGISSDNGKVYNTAVKANATVTFALPKIGLLLYPGVSYVGELEVADIGIPYFADEINDIKTNVLTENQSKLLYPKRIARSNKGTYGKLMLVAGSKDMTGAAILSAKSAYKTGVGLVNLIIPEQIQNIVQGSVYEAVTTPYKIVNNELEELSKTNILNKIGQASAIAIGPGLGRQKYVYDLLKCIIENSKVPIIIDADGLNVLAENLDLLKLSKTPIILTPHLGEMSRLTGKTIEFIQNNIIDVASNFSKIYNVIVGLKDARTIIANPDGQVYINTTGNDGLATAGSGDVLTGIIASLVAQKLDSFMGAVLGVYLHGKTADYLATKIDSRSIVASELADTIGGAWRV